jgi:hypothetical protein
MTLFKINYNNDIKEIKCNNEEKIIDLKKKITKEYNLNVDYIDLIFELEKPIRAIGKFNLESGLMPRTFDNYKLEKWNLENKEINIMFKEVDDYVEETYVPIQKKHNNTSGYRPPSSNIESGQSFIKKEPEYKLDSNEDFPSL